MKIRDVAEAAGVSIATVSRVLNHPELVTEETRERIQAIISQNNYSPNSEPRTRRSKKKQAIAVMIPTLQLYRNLHAGVRSVCKNKKYGVQLCITENDPEDLQRNLRGLIAQQVDGIILASELASPSVQEQLSENHIPYICIGGRRENGGSNLCYINYYDSACKLAEYLMGLGCRSVSLFVSHSASDCKERLKAAFLDYWDGPAAVIECEDTGEGGHQALNDLLEGELPDVIVAQYDEVAFGIIKAAAENDISVPQQLKVVGFDDSPFSTMVTPELTTVEQPTYRLGILAARRLFDTMEDEDYFDIESQEIALKGRMKIRRSCGNTKAIYEEFE